MKGMGEGREPCGTGEGKVRGARNIPPPLGAGIPLIDGETPGCFWDDLVRDAR